jgi:site-specific DNA-cytosine methylase
MLRVIREVKPHWVVAENVRGLLSIESGSVFAEVVTSLESENYEVITFCVPASAVEAPHRRDRLWIVAHAKRHGLARIEKDSNGEFPFLFIKLQEQFFEPSIEVPIEITEIIAVDVIAVIRELD